MPKKRTPKKFPIVKAVKELARERVGAPPAGKVVPDIRKKRKGEKHKSTLEELLEERFKE